VPSIDIQVLEGVFDDAEKRLIIERVSDAFGSVAGSVIRDGLSIRIHEVQSGAWGYAGKVLTTDDARKMKARGLTPDD
jgi:4-oxalocrotonate tautomerase